MLQPFTAFSFILDISS